MTTKEWESFKNKKYKGIKPAGSIYLFLSAMKFNTSSTLQDLFDNYYESWGYIPIYTPTRFKAENDVIHLWWNECSGKTLKITVPYNYIKISTLHDHWHK